VWILGGRPRFLLGLVKPSICKLISCSAVYIDPSGITKREEREKKITKKKYQYLFMPMCMNYMPMLLGNAIALTV